MWGQYFLPVAFREPLRQLPRQSLLPLVHIYAVHPLPPWSSFPSPPLHIHPHHSFPNIFFIRSHNVSVPLYLPSFTFLAISLALLAPLIIPYSVPPLIHLNIVSTLTSNFFSCSFSAQCHLAYTIYYSNNQCCHLPFTM